MIETQPESRTVTVGPAPQPLSAVIVVDPADRRPLALERALCLPLRSGAQVTVIAGSEADADGQALPEPASDGQRGVRIERRVIAEGPMRVGAVADLAATQGAELIVVGPERDGLRARLFGSLAERLAVGTHVPVLVARSSARCGAYRRVVIATDFSTVSGAAVKFALRLARGDGCQLTVVHAYDRSYLLVLRVATDAPDLAVEYAERARGSAEAGLARFLSEWAPGVELDTAVVSGDPSEVIRQVARAREADLVVVGKHAFDGAGRMWLGNVAATCVRKLHADVIVVPPPQLGH